MKLKRTGLDVKFTLPRGSEHVYSSIHMDNAGWETDEIIVSDVTRLSYFAGPDGLQTLYKATAWEVLEDAAALGVVKDENEKK